MIDHRLKNFWLAELQQSAIFLEQRYRSSKWDDELEFKVEKAIFIGFYAIRKLLESKLLPPSVVGFNWKLTCYPKLSEPVETLWLHHYNLAAGTEIKFGLKDICNQFIHSVHYSPFVPDGSFCVGFYFASDTASKNSIYYIQLVNVGNIFLSVANKKKINLSVRCSNNILSTK